MKLTILCSSLFNLFVIVLSASTMILAACLITTLISAVDADEDESA